MTLGAIAAGVIAKAQERLTERAVQSGEGVVGRLVAWLRARFTETSDDDAVRALEHVEHAPDSPSEVQTLAVVLDERATRDVEFEARLGALVEEARRDSVAASFVTEVSGDARVEKIVNIGQARDVSL